MCGPDFPGTLEPTYCEHCGGMYYPEYLMILHAYGCPTVGWAGQDSEFEKQRKVHLENVAILNQHGRPE